MKYLTLLLLLTLAVPAQAQDDPYDEPGACEEIYLSHLEVTASVSRDSLGAAARYASHAEAAIADSTGGACKTLRADDLDAALQRFVDRGIITNAVRNGIRQNMKATLDTLYAATERLKNLPHRSGQ